GPHGDLVVGVRDRLIVGGALVVGDVVGGRVLGLGHRLVVAGPGLDAGGHLLLRGLQLVGGQRAARVQEPFRTDRLGDLREGRLLGGAGGGRCVACGRIGRGRGRRDEDRGEQGHRDDRSEQGPPVPQPSTGAWTEAGAWVSAGTWVTARPCSCAPGRV